MPDKKLTDSEIVKAFKLATLRAEHPGFILCGQIVDLINRLQAEIEHIDNESSALLADIDFRENEINRLQAKVEEQQKTIDSFTDISKLYSEIKAEAYKEFADRLKEKKARYNADNFFVIDYIPFKEIDNTLKELVGDK